MEQTDLHAAHLEKADLTMARLIGSYLKEAHFEDANMRSARLENTNLTKTNLERANLRFAMFSTLTNLETIMVGNEHTCFQIADVRWENVNLSMIDWKRVKILGDEYRASQREKPDGKAISEKVRLFEYELAVRAYRPLAAVLRNQGLSEDAARFTYRAQLMQRKVFWIDGKYGQYLFSLFLDLLSGYGYKPGRCFFAYLLVIFTFATAYFIIGHKVEPALSPLGSVVFSMTSFHGRGFFPGGIGLDNPLTVVAAFEAFIGLLIEVTFIATLTQRLFSK